MRIEPITRPDPGRLRPSLRLTTSCVGLGLWLSGVLWLIFHYFLQRQTDFGLHPHPMEFWWRASHGFFGFLALWTMGFVWGTHVIGAWKSGRLKVSGGILCGLLVWLGGSGYPLYYLGNERLLTAVTLLHWSVGIVVPIPFLIHRLAGMRSGWGGRAKEVVKIQRDGRLARPAEIQFFTVSFPGQISFRPFNRTMAIDKGAT